MIPLSRLSVVLLLAIIGLIALPMALGGTSPFEDISGAAPVVLIAEIVVYFITCFIFNQRLSIVSIAFASIAMVVTRCVATILAIVSLSLLVPEQPDLAFLTAWVGNPVAVLLQMLVMMVALPQVLTALGAAGMEPEERARPASRKASGSDVAPAGGFVQVFSFEELAGFLRKTSGLEGFLILSGEGLVVWRDLPARLQVDEIGARLQNMAADTSEITEGTGLARLRSSMFQTREHLVVVSELNQNFSLILFYNARTSLADCESRLTMLVRTAREFLQWKYPGLALAGTGASQTAVPTGT